MVRASIAKQHFGIIETPLSYDKCFSLKPRNEISCHYYWNLLSDCENCEFMTPKFINKICFYYKDQNYLIFLFTHCNTEIRFQLFQNQEFFSTLMQQFLNLQWLQVFEICAKDALIFMPSNSVEPPLVGLEPATVASSYSSIALPYHITLELPLD